jgi:hypothetical protein
MRKIESILTEGLPERNRIIAVFEHAVGDTDSAACGVVHAHQHYVTLPLETVFRVRDKLRSDLLLVASGRRYESLAEVTEGHSYLSFGDLCEVDIFDGANVPSQLVRRFIGNDLGILWNWRDFVNWDWFDDTMSRLAILARAA